MTVQLPRSFEEKMRELLGEDEYGAFIRTYEEPAWAGVRVNTLKISKEAFAALSPFELDPIPWCGTGYYVPDGSRPGKHPYYHAGLYYIQEPSAMAPVECLEVLPGDKVLDLCAAPGGKSTQIAAKLEGRGLLVSNDLHPDRTKALAKNLELYGVRNGIVLNESPERIAAAFPGFFDKILIDAPCSGEGMFRKDEAMTKQWTAETPDKYADMQRAILRAAALALAPGGRMVYSTCTFSPEENEEMIAAFAAEHPAFSVVPVGGTGAFAPGLAGLPGTARLWPHKVRGEGHFVAVLRRGGSAAEAAPEGGGALAAGPHGRPAQGGREYARPAEARGGKAGLQGGRQGQGDARGRGRRGEERAAAGRRGKEGRPGQGAGGGPDAALAAFRQFAAETLAGVPAGFPVAFGDHLYLSPLPGEALDGLKAVRPGWYMGQQRSGRFTPGHPLATALAPAECLRSVSLAADGEAVSYLKGETLSVPQERLELRGGATPKGYVLVAVDGYSLGWAKWQDGMLKNEYPAGWRWT